MTAFKKAIGLVLLTCLSLFSIASDEEFLPVEQAFVFTSQQSNGQLSLHWEIADHYYLYQSRISAKQDGQALDVQFVQTPIEKEDEYFGKVQIYKHTLDVIVPLASASDVNIRFQGCAEAGLCYPPVSKTLAVNDPSMANKAAQTHSASNTLAQTSTPEKSSGNEISDITSLLKSGNLVWQLFIFFVLGLGLAFTPCVFPMIPILSSIIVGQGENLTTRRAFLMSLSYVLAMASTYAIAGVIVGYFGATANVQLYLQSPWVLGSFALVFVLLSLSMFGLYTLALPRFIQDKLSNVQQNQQGGSLISVAIMGALSALVVSPCVSAPLAGTLVYISTTGDALLGGLALLALGLGMGVPLLIIGTGGGKFLPKAGMWMDGVKNVFGVALLAIAIWLLERVVPAPVTLMLWAVLLLGSGVFLGAFEQGSKGWGRLFKALGLIFSLYGALLMVGASAQQSNPLAPLAFLAAHNNTNDNDFTSHLSREKITHSTQFRPLLANSAQQGKITVLDFYADWCIACKIMDHEVFANAQVKQALADSLFVQLDMTDNTDDQLNFLKSFNLFGPPAVLFFANGQELTELRIVGEPSAEEFLNILAKAKGLLP